MLKKTKLIIALIVSLIIIFFIPLILDWLIIGNNMPSNISNPDWVNFLGGYIGAIIGAIVSLIGIIITIRYTSNQNRSTQELQIAPYCVIRFVPDSKVTSDTKRLGYITIGCEPRSNNGPSNVSVIYIKNIGLGPAIKFQFETSEFDDGRNHYITLLQSTPESRNKAINHLQPGEEAAFPIIIDFNFDPINEDDFVNYEHNGVIEKDLSQKVLKKYKSFDIELKVTHFDMFHNEFTQNVIIGFDMSVRTVQQKYGEHICTPYLKEVTPPTRSLHT